MTDRLIDANGDNIQLGDEVMCGAEKGIITEIYSTEDLEGHNPQIFVTFGYDGVEKDVEKFLTTCTMTWWDDYNAPWRCDDLELAVVTA